MTLYSFDFDDTLFHTQLPETGENIWKQKTGTDWPHRGWWSKPETLDIDIFPTPINKWTYEEYLKVSEESDAIKICATGRLQRVEGMRENLIKILLTHNLSFDEIWTVPSPDPLQKTNGKNGIYLNWGGDTYTFKTTLFSKLIEITGCDHFVMYDDRVEHLIRFEEWAREQSIPVTIKDSIRHTTTTIEN